MNKLNKIKFTAMLAVLFAFFSVSNAIATVKGELTTVPNVPAPIKRSKPATVVIKLEAKEYVGEIATDVKYGFWSYNGIVPGPMARVKVGDSVEFHLSNMKDNTQPHNIDIHAVNGAHGGAAMSTVSPGESKVFTFKVMAPGLYIYHCAAGSIVDHISNGMYGLILVEPKEGLPAVDKEFYVMQSEFFATEPDEKGLASFDIQKGLDENPTYVVFNGKSGALMEKNALKAKVGDNVRIFFGNIGPNSVSSFHIIGEIFDTVYMEGGIGGPLNKNIQTTLVPAAGATIVEFKVDYPGSYLLVDHSIFRVAKGAIGQIMVDGKKDKNVIRQGK